MSFELAGRVIGDPELSDIAEFTVMLALADATNKETHTCYPSVGRISFVARLSRRKAFMVIKALEKKGWIQVIRRRGKKRMPQSSLYQIIKYGAPDASGVVHSVHQGSAHGALGGSAHGAPKPVKDITKKEPGQNLGWSKDKTKKDYLSSDHSPDPLEQEKVFNLFKDLKHRFKAP